MATLNQIYFLLINNLVTTIIKNSNLRVTGKKLTRKYSRIEKTKYSPSFKTKHHTTKQFLHKICPECQDHARLLTVSGFLSCFRDTEAEFCSVTDPKGTKLSLISCSFSEILAKL